MSRADSINLENVYPDLVVKNYSELCTLLNIKQNTNIQKQLNSLSKFLRVEKIEGTRKYVIREVYDSKNYELNVRGNSRYTKYIQDILLNELFNALNSRVIYTHKQLMTEFANVNPNFYKDNSEIAAALNSSSNAEIKDMKIKTDEVKGFKEFVETNTGYRIRRGLENIESRKLINIMDGYMIQENDYRSHIANKHDSKLIRDMEIYLFNKYKYSNWGEVYLYKSKIEEFMRDWHEATRIFGMNVYRVRIITLNPDALKEKNNIKFNIEKSKKELNSVFIEIVREAAINGAYKKDNTQRYKDVNKILCQGLLSIDSDLSSELRDMIKKQEMG